MGLKKDIIGGIIGAILVAVIFYNSGPAATIISFIITVAIVSGWSIYKNNKNKNTKTGTSTIEK